MQPLTNLTKKTVAFDWSPDCDKAFQAVKAALSSPPVLALPQLGPDAPPFSVVSDASGFALGACLMQAGHPVAYESRTMIPAERNYSTGEQELLAVVHAFKVWRPYLECGRTVTVVTDHRPNIYLPTQTLMSRRKARWNEFLSRFVIDWQHRPGRTNVADPLSRAPHLLAWVGDGRVHPLLQDIINGYASDPWFRRARNIEPLVETDGCFITLSGQICVPDVSDIRNKVISEAHDPSYRGHPGILRTTKNVQRDHWWPGMTSDVRAYVKQCVSCQMNKPTSTRPAGTLQPLPIPEYPWQCIAMDFIVQIA